MGRLLSLGGALCVYVCLRDMELIMHEGRTCVSSARVCTSSCSPGHSLCGSLRVLVSLRGCGAEGTWLLSLPVLAPPFSHSEDQLVVG